MRVYKRINLVGVDFAIVGPVSSKLDVCRSLALREWRKCIQGANACSHGLEAM